jgi:uncharacterized protein YcfL
MKTTNSRRIAPVAALLIGVMLQACTAPPRGTPTNTFTGGETGKEEQFIGDRDLAAKFVLLDIKREHKDGRLRVQFDLKNTTPGDLAIEWAVRWQDASGFDIDTNPHWVPVMVAGKGLTAIQLIAPTPEASSFQLQFRKPTSIR